MPSASRIEQDAFSCRVMYRTNGLGQALLFLLALLRKQLSVSRINILCVARDFSILLPVADTMPITYGAAYRRPQGEPPLLMPEKLMEPCTVDDLSLYRTFLNKTLTNENIPLFHYASMFRMPLFPCGDYVFTFHIWSERKAAFSSEHIELLHTLLEPLREDLRDCFSGRTVVASPLAGAGTGVERLSRCPGLARVLAKVGNVAPTRSTVLISGETGVGKESVAEAIHELSSRSREPFVKVNCGAIAETLIDSELFGHERGAFTGAHATRSGYFELASGGTLFLDEIGELSLSAQVRLLRVLDSGTFCRVGNPRPFSADVRLIAATNRDLRQRVREGKFRQDLYYRLAVYPVHVPPLRERREDITALTDYFIHTKAADMGMHILPRVPAAEGKKLLAHSWPGNVRELEFVVERALIDSRPEGRREGVICFTPLAPADEQEPDEQTLAGDWPTLALLNERYIAMVLKKTGGRLSGPNGAAGLLGIHYSTLYSHMKKGGKQDGSPRGKA